MKKLWIALVLVYPHLSLAEFKPVATVLIHNPAELINQAVDLGVALETPVERATAESLIADILMAGETAGVDLAAPIEMFFYQDTQAADAMDPIYAARFKLLDDGAGYLQSVEQKFSEREDLEGGEYRLSRTEFEEEQTLWLLITNGMAIYCENKNVLAIPESPYSDDDKAYLESVERGVSLIMDPEVASEAWRELLAQSESEENLDPSSKAIVDLFKKYADPASRQLDAFIMNLDIADGVTLAVHARAVDGSFLDQVMDASAKPPDRISGYVDDAALLSAYGSMGGLDLLIPKYAGFIEEFYRAYGPPLDAVADDFKAMILPFAGVFKGGYNLFIYPGNEEFPFAMAGAYEIHDPAAAKSAVESMIAFQNQMPAQETNSFSVKYTKQDDVQPYQGVTIESYRMAYDIGEIPGVPGEDMDTAIDDMFKDTLYHLAYLDSHMVYAIGPLDNLHRLIDSMLGPEPAARMLPAFPAEQGDAHGYWEINLRKIAEIDPEKTAALGLDAIDARIQGVQLPEAGGHTAKVKLTANDLKGISSLVGMLFAMSMPPSGDPGEEAFEQYDETYYEDESEEPDHYIEEEIDWDESSGEEIPADGY